MALDKGTGGPRVVKPPQPKVTPQKPTTYYSPPRLEPFQLSLQQWQNALPDVNPNTIADLYKRGVRVNRVPNAPNPYTTGILAGTPQIYYSGNQLGTTRSGIQATLGHETVHAWQRYSNNPISLLARGMEAGSALYQAAKGMQYDPGFGNAYANPFRTEGQASMYYGPENSTHRKGPEWFRQLALAGYLQPAPVIPGWGARVMNARRR